jgi:pimeloyl-ACP methyl ester carboxylesterase
LTENASQIRPYRIEVDQAVLDDLDDRLARTRLGDEPEGAGWDYGTSLSYLRELIDYWVTAFDWRRQEHGLNQLRQFQVSAGGLDIHFAHHTAPVSGALPLLLLHGWPTGFPEMTRLMLLLDGTFDVIVPSLPGYSFSGVPRGPGYGYRRAAQDLHSLVTGALGYQRYGVHSTGAGAFVAGWLALEYPAAVVGLHTHDPALMPPASFDPPGPPPTAAELAFLERSGNWSTREGAYADVHRTKPQSLAPALQDSPAGLAGWLLDKYRTWSDCNDDLESRWSKDDLLTVITLHWVTGDIGSSMRAYYERVHHDHIEPGVHLQVPTGVAMPRDDPRFPPRRVPKEMVRRTHNLQHWVDLPRGGHFASWEEPGLVSTSIRNFFEPLW